MMGDDAKAKCPNIHFFRVPEVRGKADLTKFREAGAEVIAVLSKFSDCVERASIDEAYIDLTEEVKKRMDTLDSDNVSPEQLPNTFIVGWGDNKDGSKRGQGVRDWIQLLPSNNSGDNADQKLLIGAVIAEEMRAAVYKETGFRCSAGIAHNKMLAKLACGIHKPNKQTILPHSSVQQLFDGLPLTKIRNLGGKLGHSVMEQLAIENMGELCQFELHTLQQKFGEKTGSWLYEVCRGIEHEPVSARQLAKSIGCSKNFPGKTCLDTKEKVKFWLLELSKEVAERLNKDKEMNSRIARSMTVSVRYLSNPSPVVASRACAVTKYDAEKIANDAYSLILKLNNAPAHQAAWSPPILCLGVSATKFQDEGNNQSTLSLSSFRGQKSVNQGSASQPQSTSSQQTKLPTKTIASFFQKEKDCKDQQNKDHQENCSLQEEVGSKSCKDNDNDKNEGNDDESDRFISQASYLASDSLTAGDKRNKGSGFFAMRKIEKKSCQNSSETTLISDQMISQSHSKELEQGTCVWKSSEEDKSSENLVDPDFLAALPIELRQEVLSQMKCVSTSKGNQTVGHEEQKQKDKTSMEKYLSKHEDQHTSVTFTSQQSFVTCSKCNKQVEENVITEHMDFHFAKELQKELTWTSDKNSGQNEKSSGQRKRSLGDRGLSPKKATKKMKNNAGKTQTISHFFNKNLST
ncbi:DNA polymerase eta-like isoform X2 [Magallana gigas]